MAVQTIANSSFLDFSGYRQTTATTVEAAYGIDPSSIGTAHLNVALVLARANDPTALLNSDWATRQQTLATLNANGTLWSTYGADQLQYNSVVSALTTMGIPILGDAAGSDGYISSAASRTIWVSLDSSHFQTLFQTALVGGTYGNNYSLQYWNGNLSLPTEWNVVGIAPDESAVPTASTLSGSATATLSQGPQSPGNAASQTAAYFPGQIASTAYNFPLAGTSVATGTVGLLEPGIGDAMPDKTTITFQQGLDNYRATAGLTTSGTYYSVTNNGQSYSSGNGLERSLDAGVIASAAPQSTIGLYTGSGTQHGAQSSTYSAYQAAFWDLLNNPAVISSSWGDVQQSAPGSVFQEATLGLFVDAALRNITAFAAVGDGGSGDQMANGLTNLAYSYSSALGILVGGTSLSTSATASTDATLAAILASVAAGDLGTIWQLISGGLTQWPQAGSSATVIETAWNQYVLNGSELKPGYLPNNTGTGGVDPTQATPWYQTAFGLTPTTSDPLAQVGRGAPDVAALAGGNMLYIVPPPGMTTTAASNWNDFGTSAASPLWAALWAQMNAIFHDQGLPNLGYSNDLLYIAAVVAPASFNDITIGSNTSSYTLGGSISTPGASGGVTATGFGYSAGAGYDLVTGLGTPNGELLARALTAIAHAQMYFDTPQVLGQSASGTWVAPVTESLLFQPMLTGTTHVDLAMGSSGYGYDGHASGSFAWTSQLAQQALQSDFSAQLTTLFDAQSQSTPLQVTAQAGAGLQVNLHGAATTTPQASLSSPYGFVDFVSADSSEAVQVARTVMVAETAGATNDQEAVVRLRQVGTYDLDVLFFKVDDYSGTIGDLAPGQSGYDGAVLARAYQAATGSSWIDGPGFGGYGQTEIAHVNAGDLIAMALTTNGHTYYAFTAANPDAATHVWNYGLNTYGWEDTFGGGDRDYNDLVVQLDFTSTAGHGYLV